MRPLSTSIYTFSNLIEGGFLYVDKTPLIRQLLQPAFGLEERNLTDWLIEPMPHP